MLIENFADEQWSKQRAAPPTESVPPETPPMLLTLPPVKASLPASAAAVPHASAAAAAAEVIRRLTLAPRCYGWSTRSNRVRMRAEDYLIEIPVWSPVINPG